MPRLRAYELNAFDAVTKGRRWLVREDAGQARSLGKRRHRLPISLLPRLSVCRHVDGLRFCLSQG